MWTHLPVTWRRMCLSSSAYRIYNLILSKSLCFIYCSTDLILYFKAILKQLFKNLHQMYYISSFLWGLFLEFYFLPFTKSYIVS